MSQEPDSIEAGACPGEVLRYSSAWRNDRPEQKAGLEVIQLTPQPTLECHPGVWPRIWLHSLHA